LVFATAVTTASCAQSSSGAAVRRSTAAVAPAPVVREAPAVTEEKIVHLEPIRIEVVKGPDGRPTVEATDARSLLDAGNEDLVAGRYDQALTLYDRLVRDFGDSELVVPALFNAGLALEGKGELDAAVDRYQGVVRRAPTGADSRDAHLRAVAVLSEQERWPLAARLVDEFLARPDLGAGNRLEGLARRGYIAVELGDYAGAESELHEAVRIAEQEQAAGRLAVDDYYGAMAHYYLAEIPRRQFAVLPIRLPESQMTNDLNQKAELVLLAGQRYDRAIATGNLYWATAAGYQIASMQAEFRDAIVLAPIPPHLDPAAAAEYERRVHKEARRFLDKALRIHQQTVELARLYRTTTPWADAAVIRAEQITALLARESAGELVKPDGLGGHHAPVARPAKGAAYAPGRVDL